MSIQKIMYWDCSAVNSLCSSFSISEHTKNHVLRPLMTKVSASVSFYKWAYKKSCTETNTGISCCRKFPYKWAYKKSCTETFHLVSFFSFCLYKWAYKKSCTETVFDIERSSTISVYKWAYKKSCTETTIRVSSTKVSFLYLLSPD